MLREEFQAVDREGRRLPRPPPARGRLLHRPLPWPVAQNVGAVFQAVTVVARVPVASIRGLHAALTRTPSPAPSRGLINQQQLEKIAFRRAYQWRKVEYKREHAAKNRQWMSGAVATVHPVPPAALFPALSRGEGTARHGATPAAACSWRVRAPDV